MTQATRPARRRAARAALLPALALAAAAAGGCRAPQVVTPPPPLDERAFAGVEGPLSELAALAERARPSLVRVRAETALFKSPGRYLRGLADGFLGVLTPHPYWEWPYRLIAFPLYLIFGAFDLGSGSGSGAFVADDLVVTNAHVIDNAARISCELTDGRRAAAVVVAADEARDLALLRVVDLEGERPPALPLRRARTRPGEVVLAMGFPARDSLAGPLGRAAELEARPNPTLSVGLVAATEVELGNAVTRYLQTDAALNPGSSGGPLVGLDGTLVGVATMISVGKENEGYAVPAEAVLEAFRAHLPAPSVDGAEGEGAQGGDGGDGARSEGDPAGEDGRGPEGAPEDEDGSEQSSGGTDDQ